MARLDIYWSFRSPYSYLAIDRLIAIAEDYSIETQFRPVRPLAMREPDFFERNRPQFMPYLMRDVFRESQRLGIPFGPPRPDPIRMDFATGRVDREQPIMTRLMNLGLAAVELGKGMEFAAVLGRNIWGGRENWHEPDAMAAAAKTAGLDLATLEDFAGRNADRLLSVLAGNETEQLKHHWGVPLMVLDEEPFFGQDRLDALVWRLNQQGLQR
jgi:2-hydroxychromene-2-carboxylate isomerase